ncbi:MAG TPA: T9SS type A sorting domain-containing protein, partial [Bacteroidota bacterium]|nr:T9SS type A sorting domain-containing protein [Bacteroidota bacterium]
TCTGCYWAKRHLQIETSPMEDSCWTITITNTSSCDYESLQLLMQEVSNDFEGFRIENDNFKTVIYGHNHYFYKNTSLKSGQTYIIQMCGDPNKYYSYKFMLGTFILDSQIVDGNVLYSRQLIVCDSLSDIFTSGPCCENINIVRTNWVWRMAPDCQISYQPLNKMIYIHHSLGDGCAISYNINIEPNQCNIDTIDMERINMFDITTFDTTYCLQGQNSLSFNISVPYSNEHPNVFTYHFKFKDQNGDIKCERIYSDLCVCIGIYPTIRVATIKDQDVWHAIISAMDTAASGVGIYGILARDANNPNNIYFCEQKQAGLEPPFDLSTPLVLDTITVPLDSAIHAEVYFLDADSIVVGYARYDGNIYNDHNYIVNFKIIPNPTNSNLGIYYHISEPVEVNVSVWDILGRKLYDFGTTYHQIGDYNLNLDISSYPSGSYYVRTIARGDVQSVPFVIQR